MEDIDQQNVVQPKPGNFWLRQWLRRSVHFGVLVVITLIFAVNYYSVHIDNKIKYENDVSDLITASLKTYQIGANEEDGQLHLTLNSEPIDLAEIANGSTPLGSGEMISVQGVLNEYQSDIGLFNQIINARLSALGHGAVNLGEGFVGVRIQSIVPETLGYFEVDTEAWSQVTNQPGFAHVELARNLVTGARRAWRAPVPLPVTANTSRINSLAEAEERLREVSEASADTAILWNTEPLDQETISAINSHFEGWLEEGWRESILLTTDTDTDTNINCDPTSTLEPLTTGRIQGAYNAKLQCELTSVIKKEIGFFWRMGSWRWMEYILWAMFGVFVQALIEQGKSLRGFPGVIWKPADTLHILGKLLYAPLLVVGVFFLARYAGLDDEATELSNSSLAPMGFAFILGMYPITAYNLLLSIVKSIFRPEVATTRTPPTGKKRRVETDDQPKTITELKDSIVKTVTAPLERTNIGSRP